MPELLAVALGFLLGLIGIWLWKQMGRAPNRFVRGSGSCIAVLLMIFSALSVLVGGVLYWYAHRPLPPNARQSLFEGVAYIREFRREPRPLIIHVILVNLDTPGLDFLVTPGEAVPNGELRARTTSQFLDEFNFQLAINGDFFTPWYSHNPWNYYPHVGDPIYVSGFAVSNGDIYSEAEPAHPTLYISRHNHHNQAGFNAPADGVYNAISGSMLFLENGQVQPLVFSHAYNASLHPRTAVALDKTMRTLMLVVVDGRQPNYSEGVTLAELAEIVAEYGGDTALNLDGGGSSTLVMEGDAGKPVLLNSPIDNRIPGRERPVGNHLGIYAPKLRVKPGE